MNSTGRPSNAAMRNGPLGKFALVPSYWINTAAKHRITGLIFSISGSLRLLQHLTLQHLLQHLLQYLANHDDITPSLFATLHAAPVCCADAGTHYQSRCRVGY